MGWETRTRGGRYYTRSQKVDGRVVREYVGGGLAGALAAQDDTARRAHRATERARLAAMGKRDAALVALVAEFDADIESLAHVALYAAGYRRHHRGEWRKRRAQEA
jgi:hypothetical protein